MEYLNLLLVLSVALVFLAQAFESSLPKREPSHTLESLGLAGDSGDEYA